MTRTLYAIGDIHGQAEELHRVLDLIARDGGADAEIVLVGDYTDRGPDSRGVLETLIEARDTGRPWHFIKGNHDRMFEWFMGTYPQHEAYLPVDLGWLHPRLGGETTLASYGVTFSDRARLRDVHRKAREKIPQAHVDFLQSLDLTFETPELFFAHAGIRPGVPLDQQDEEDLLWIRREFHDHRRPHPKLIVHGHTPINEATHYGNRINLDSGAGYGDPLTVAVFEGTDCWTLDETGRHRLTP